jgi:tRNA pseudouridine55 synthase
LNCGKEYEGTIEFGAETDTLDPEGEVIAEGALPSREEIEAALPVFRGDILQEPPAYSALHIDGKRAYELARQGKAPEMKKRPVTVHELELTSWDPPFAGIRVSCSSGTYIRSLARDIALAAGTRAHLVKLHRTRVGGFSVSGAAVPGDMGAEALKAALKPISAAVFDALEIPWITVNEEQSLGLVHGKPLASLIKDQPQSPALGVFSASPSGKTEFRAVLEWKNNGWNYGYVLNSN